MKYTVFILLALTNFLFSATAYALPVDVTFSVSGSPNSWVYDFTVTNNLGGNLDIYAFSPLGTYPSLTPASGPTNWSVAYAPAPLQFCNTAYTPCDNLGSNELDPGGSLAGFIYHDSALHFANSIRFSIAAIQTSPFFSNPTFAGTARVSPVPLSPTIIYLLAGVVLLLSLGLYKKRKAMTA